MSYDRAEQSLQQCIVVRFGAQFTQEVLEPVRPVESLGFCALGAFCIAAEKRFREPLASELRDVRVRRDGQRGKILLQGPPEPHQLASFAWPHEGDGHAGASRTSSSPNPVHIDFRILRKVEVHHVCDVIDVDATCSHIGCDDHVHLLGTKAGHHLLSRLLAEITVQGGSRNAALHQRFHDIGSACARAHEDQRGLPYLRLEDPDERLAFETLGHRDDVLRNVRSAQRARLDLNLDRRAQVLLRHLADRCGHGGRKERHLLVTGGVRNDALNGLKKSHAKHFVGFVKHKKLHGGEVEGATVEVIDDTSGGTHDDVNAGAKRLQLRAIG